MQSPSVREGTEEHARVSLLDLDNTVVSVWQTHKHPRKQTSYRLAHVTMGTNLRSLPYSGDQQVVDCISLNDVNSRYSH